MSSLTVRNIGKKKQKKKTEIDKFNKKTNFIMKKQRIYH